MAQDTFTIKQNDLLPAIQRTLYDENDTAVDLTGATVVFTMKKGSTVKINEASATLVDAANGIVKYDWASGDTDTVGQYDAEFEVTYPSTKPETFPNDGYIKVRVTPELA